MTERRQWGRPGGVASAVLVVALLLLVPGLGDHGFWSEGELGVLDRTRAALGAGLSGLERSPWLSDWVRTRSYAALDGEMGLRLPHAVAGAMLAALAAALARVLGIGVSGSIVAGLLVLAFPAVAVSSRTALGNPIGELLGTVAALLGAASVRASSVRVAAVTALSMAVALALSIAASGLVLGGVLPLGAIALAVPERSSGPRTRRAAIAVHGVAWGAVLVTAGVAVHLALGQGEGYIPILGAAKDLELMNKPELRRFSVGLEDSVYALFPFAPLCVLGLLSSRGRWPALWALLGVVVVAAWSLLYGTTPAPIAVPAAVAMAASIELFATPDHRPVVRRLAVVIVVMGVTVLRKDAERTPSRVVAPVHPFLGEHTFPARAIDATQTCGRIGGLLMLAALGAAVVGRRHERGLRIERALGRVPARARDVLAVGSFGVAALYGAMVQARVLVPDLSDHLSPRALLETHGRWAEAGALPAELGTHRTRDRGLAWYGPTTMTVLQSRREIGTWLGADEPRVALVRDLDIPLLHQQHRIEGWPFYVLDDRHAHYRLVANVLPDGAIDRNVIPEIVSDEPPALANETYVAFAPYAELVGWEVEGPLVQGRKHKLRLAFHVLRPLPGGSKVYARFLRGRLFRINGEAVDLTGGVYPPNLWRRGEYVVHEMEFDVPTLEILPGTYDFVIGLRRGERDNYAITEPEGERGEHGVEILDKKRQFAKIGEVKVW